MRDPYSIIVKPLITEKTTGLKEESNKHVFMVCPDANKIEIKKAVETLFKVSVVKVHTFNQKGKVKRLGVHSGKRADWKKAIVTLTPESHIDFFESV
ncbi:50S ribosomal protein L23 [bacterium]|nr:50S ribosomal protein L23 [bacterium]